MKFMFFEVFEACKKRWITHAPDPPEKRTIFEEFAMRMYYYEKQLERGRDRYPLDPDGTPFDELESDCNRISQELDHKTCAEMAVGTYLVAVAQGRLGTCYCHGD